MRRTKAEMAPEKVPLIQKRIIAKCNDLEPGEHVVIMGGLPIASQARTNFVKLHRVGDGK